MYMASMIFTQLHTCMCDSQTSRYFNTIPPTLEGYLKGGQREPNDLCNDNIVTSIDNFDDKKDTDSEILFNP